MKTVVVLFCISVLLLSCDKGEIPVTPKPDNGLTQGVGDLGSTYGDQIFYDLNSNTIVLQQDKYFYDLKIGMADTNDFIFLNSSKGMGVDFIENANFSDNIVLGNLTFQVDSPSGILDSNAMGEWWNKEGLFVIHRGYSSSGANLGYFKLRAKKVGLDIRLIFSEMDGSQLDSVLFTKDPTYNYMGFSYDTKQAEICEPNNNTWDLLLTQYMFIYPDSATYLVAGALQNPKRTSAAILITDYDETNLQDAISHTLLWKEDVLGFDWKFYNYDDQVYEIVPNQFLVKSQSGTFFKLRFIDFYNQQGEKGAISFEYLPL